MKENSKKIAKQIMEDGGHFYVCGDISMAADVNKTLQDILENMQDMTEEKAKTFVNSMKDRGVYHEDIFGVTFKHEEVTNKHRRAAKMYVL